MGDVVVKEVGGCLCGLVRYSFDRDSVISAGHCHCTDCQKATGSGKATIVLVPSDNLEMSGEYKIYSVIGSDGSHVSRGFCPACGSPIISFVKEQPEIKFIKAGSLDESSWVKVQASYWQISAQYWDPVRSDVPGFEKNPLL